MNVHGDLHSLIGQIGQWSESAEGVRACFTFGGYATGKVDRQSDVDLAMVLESGILAPGDLLEAMRRLTVAAGFETIWSAHYERDCKLVLWLDPGAILLDITYAFDAVGLDWLADAADVPPPRLRPLWIPAEEELRQLVRKAQEPVSTGKHSRRRFLAETEIDKFLLSYDACSKNLFRGDSYGFFFQYNLALGRLVRLIQLCSTGSEFLYQPRNVLENLLTEQDRSCFQHLAGTLFLREGVPLKTRIAARFLQSLDEARSALGVRQKTAALQKLLEAIDSRDNSLHAEERNCDGR